MMGETRGFFSITRRDMLGGMAAAPALLAAAAQGFAADGEGSAGRARDFSAGAPPVPYPDPDVLVVHPSFTASQSLYAVYVNTQGAAPG
jgi:hypothetical protein